MKKKITFTASYVFEVDDEWLDEVAKFETFEDVEDSDYDNIGRPLERLRDLDWKIEKTKIEDYE